MREPKLNRSLVLETAVRVTDGAGGYTTRWEPLGVVWAEVVGKTGRHLQQGQHAAALQAVRITMRAAPQGAVSRPKAGQRLLEGTRTYEIIAVADHPRDPRFLVCDTQEVVSA